MNELPPFRTIRQRYFESTGNLLKAVPTLKNGEMHPDVISYGAYYIVDGKTKRVLETYVCLKSLWENLNSKADTN